MMSRVDKRYVYLRLRAPVRCALRAVDVIMLRGAMLLQSSHGAIQRYRVIDIDSGDITLLRALRECAARYSGTACYVAATAMMLMLMLLMPRVTLLLLPPLILFTLRFTSPRALRCMMARREERALHVSTQCYYARY